MWVSLMVRDKRFGLMMCTARGESCDTSWYGLLPGYVCDLELVITEFAEHGMQVHAGHRSA